MIDPVLTRMPDGRLLLRHGPITLLCRAWGEPAAIADAYHHAARCFPAILPALCAERPALRAAVHEGARPSGAIARAMRAACLPYAAGFITPMAAVAGAVADAVLAQMARAPIERGFVNNGGDIAFHLAPGQALHCGLVTDVLAPSLNARLLLRADGPSRGIATSGSACKGRGGRSASFGIADSVTVLARTAAEADAAATVVANAVDLPGHPAIVRRPADTIDPDSDLGRRPITWSVGALTPAEIERALAAGRLVAERLLAQGLIHGAVLALRGCLVACHPVLELA